MSRELTIEELKNIFKNDYIVAHGETIQNAKNEFEKVREIEENKM